MYSPHAEEFVAYALEIGALELIPAGRKLKSERISPYFFNAGLFSTAWHLKKLAKAYTAVVTHAFPKTDVIFGPAYKGMPLAVATATALSDTLGKDVAWAFNRKEKKPHGEEGDFVGQNMNGKQVLIVDDVITTGESVAFAVKFIRAHGGNPLGCVVAFDRQERIAESVLSAREVLEKNIGVPVKAAAGFMNLVRVLQRGEYPDKVHMIPLLFRYQQDYGIRAV